MTMSKKNYIAPVLYLEDMETEEMICNSIAGIEGDSGLELGIGDVPEDAESRFFKFPELLQ